MPISRYVQFLPGAWLPPPSLQRFADNDEGVLMFKHVIRPPSPALVIAMIALAIALGGTAVAASRGGGTKAVTKLIKKLAPTLSVKHARTATALSNVTYVKGNVVDAPPNNGGTFTESPASNADCPGGTVLIGSYAVGGGEGVEASPSNVNGTPPAGVEFYFDNFENVDRPTNYAIAICAPAASVTNPDGLAPREATRR
jgi:hypothetical protein